MVDKEKIHQFFGGELVIKPTGIYTYAHYYEHPETQRIVVIIGTSHGGEKDYYRQILQILNGLEFVLFERLSLASAESIEKSLEQQIEDLEKKFKENPDEACVLARDIYFKVTDKYLQLVSEASIFNSDVTDKINWESSDDEFIKSLEKNEKIQAYCEGVKKAFDNLPGKDKSIIIEHIIRALNRIKNKQFVPRDLGVYYIMIWSNPDALGVDFEVVYKPRGDMMIEVFDRIIKDKNPKSIGIKFGAAHIVYQRELLEQRSYRHFHSVELCNIAFQ